MPIPVREKSDCSHIFEQMQNQNYSYKCKFGYSEILVESVAKCTSLRNSMHICWGFKKINSSHTTEDETLFRIILSRLKEI